MSEQHNETQPPMPPPPAPSRWKWALALAIPGGFVGTHFFGFMALTNSSDLARFPLNRRGYGRGSATGLFGRPAVGGLLVADGFLVFALI